MKYADINDTEFSSRFDLIFQSKVYSIYLNINFQQHQQNAVQYDYKNIQFIVIFKSQLLFFLFVISTIKR